MTNKISSASGPTNRPRLCRSDHQPNMLEYIDTTLNDSFSSRLKIQSTTTNSTAHGYDQFGNTIVDQYLVYILCQKLHPNRTDNLYQSLHHLLISNGTISKSFFEYSPPPPSSSINRAAYQSLFHSYTNFIWNEFDVDILLELACFLLKYRLRDIFTAANKTSSVRHKITGYFLEIIGIYYLSANHREFFLHSRSADMLFPYPTTNAEEPGEVPTNGKDNDTSLFTKFLRRLYDNGEVSLDLRLSKSLLQADTYQFLNKKLENKKVGFLNFFESNVRAQQQQHSCRSLKSFCRLVIKMHVKQFPNDIEHLSLFPAMTDRLLTFLTYENKYAFESTA